MSHSLTTRPLTTTLGVATAAIFAFTSVAATAQIAQPGTPIFGGFVVSAFDPVTITEGDAANYNLVLINAPSEPVTITASASDASLVSLAQTTYSFDASNWSILQPVSVTSLIDTNDTDDTVQLQFVISTASPEFVGVEVQTRTLTILDGDSATGGTGGDTDNGDGNDDTNDDNSDNDNNDDNSDNGSGDNSNSDNGNNNDETASAGFTVTPNTELTVNEGGFLTGAYDVVLTSRPDSPVTIQIDSNNPNSVTFNGLGRSTITFDETDWDQAKQVSVEGAEDDNVNDDSAEATFDVISGPNDYLNLANQSRRVTAVDNDSATGGTGDQGDNSDNDNGNSSDMMAGLTVTPSTMLEVDEGDFLTGAYDVSLDAAPGGTVMIEVTSNTPNSITVNGQLRTTLMFDDADWDQAKQVSVEGVEDDNVNDEEVRITFDPVSGPNDYLNLANETRIVMTRDNDTNTGGSDDNDNGNNPDATAAALLVTPDTQVEVMEGMLRQAGYQVRLATNPGQTVTLLVDSNNPNLLTLNGSGRATLVFDETNWDQPQALDLQAFEDDNTTDDSVFLTFDIVSGPNEYNNLGNLGRSVLVLDNDRVDTGDQGDDTNDDTDTDNGNTDQDNDSGDGTNDNTGDDTNNDTDDNSNNNDDDITIPDSTPAAILLNPIAPLAIQEGTTISGAYNLALASAPESDVTVTVTSDDLDGQLFLNGNLLANLTFTPENFATPQVLEVTAFEDDNFDSETYTLTFDVFSGPANYLDLDSMTRIVNVADNDFFVGGGANPDEDNNDAGDDVDTDVDTDSDNDMTPDTDVDTDTPDMTPDEDPAPGFGGANPDADNNDGSSDSDSASDDMDNAGNFGGTGNGGDMSGDMGTPGGLIRTGGLATLASSSTMLLALTVMLVATGLTARAIYQAR